MPDITFYGLTTCIHCKKAKEYLDEKNADYELVYVDKLEGDERQKCISEVKKHNPSLSFPTILVNGRVIVGFKKSDLEEALEG